jgi:CubicO group peptidase (beta-lactamase class C family)
MVSAIPQGRLAEIVQRAQARTGVQVDAAALHIEGRTMFAGAHERPHTAGYRLERAEPLPPECAGLWSYSNAGYQEAAAGFDGDYSDAVRELVLEPLGLRNTGFETPHEAVLGTHPDSVVADPSHPVERRAVGGRWST